MGCKNIWEQLARLLLFGLRSSLSPLTSFFFSRFHFLIFTFFKKKNFFFYFLFFIYFFLISTIKRYWHQLQYPLSQLGVIADLDSQYFYLTSCCLSIVLISNDVSTMMSAGWRCSPDLILFRMNRKRKCWYYIKWYNFVSQFTTWRVIIGEDVLPHGPQTLFTSHNSPMWWFVIQNYAIFYGPNTTHKENMALLWLDAFNGMRVEMFLLSNEKKKEVFKKN